MAKSESSKNVLLQKTRKKRFLQRSNRRLDDGGPYDHQVIDIYPSSLGSLQPDEARMIIIDKLNDAANGDTVVFHPGHYVINASICPFEKGTIWSAHPSYTIRGVGDSPSDTVLFGMEFNCNGNNMVIENIEVWGSQGQPCEYPGSFDEDSGLIFRNSIVKTYGKPFDLLAHKINFLNSEYINMLPGSSNGLIDNDRMGFVAIRSKFFGFDAAIEFDNQMPDPSDEVVPKVYGNTFEGNCADCAFESTTGCANILANIEPNTPKGNSVVVTNLVDILRHQKYGEKFLPPISNIKFKKVSEKGETTVYRIPNGYSILDMPSGFYPVYTHAAHAYQFDSTAVYKKFVTISFKREEVFGSDCSEVEFFYYRKSDGMEKWKSLKLTTKQNTWRYTVTLKKAKIPLDGTIVAAFVPES
eukprot:CAMPEP_0194286470 /NCGR_PEP_ID=MMETSP0169-20130528/32604_1 /TAXON_ID=218684 /ORGANISM="Corethron pennatum, Strain L29A3" /LENGTH=412 /DNA_ID=CAMNT_0039032915 /DNA_START=223 /DNA_END=1458 /DNA_ORIENTATION=+